VREDEFRPIVPPVVARHAPTGTLLRAVRRDGPEGLDIALYGVPMDQTTVQRPGARHGPYQAREFSWAVRAGSNSVTGAAPFDLCKVGDIGDAHISHLDDEGTLKNIEEFVQAIVDAGALPLGVGGEHTISLPILRAVAGGERGPVGLVHFDAHPDTIDTMVDYGRYAPGTPFRRSSEEGLTLLDKHVMIGIRGTSYGEELQFAHDNGVTVIGMDELDELRPKGVALKIREIMGDMPVYVTFDMDAIDISAAPGTNFPEPGGLTIREAQGILRGLTGMNIVGADVVCFSPPLDPSGNTALVVNNLMFELLCILAIARTQQV
jgi:guanidinopropionase